MIQAVPELMTFEQFLDWYPEDGRQFELIEGIPVEMNPTGTHEDVAGFLVAELSFHFRVNQLPYSIPRTCTVRPHRDRTGYKPDVTVLDQNKIDNEPLWKKRSTIIHSETVVLAIEVISTNWRDDYGLKLTDYEAMGIPEYWIVDYLALGAARYIGRPKQPTLSVYRLVDGEYLVEQFRGDDRIISQTFPDLQMTANEVFRNG